MEIVPAAVAQAAMESGVAQKPIEDMAAYRQSLKARLNPTTSVLTLAYEGARAEPKRVVFAEAEEHTFDLKSLMRISYAVFCLKEKKNYHTGFQPSASEVAKYSTSAAPSIVCTHSALRLMRTTKVKQNTQHRSTRKNTR